MAALVVGSLFAGHRVEAVLGRGGMGVVYLAIDLALERPVALKVVAPQLSEEDEFRERFKREGRLAASLRHPGVTPVYAAGEHDGLLFVTMMFVEGTDLRRLLAAEGALSPQRAGTIVAQVAGALDAAHGRGLVHRDVKPANILLEQDPDQDSPRAYLTDFGLARALESSRLSRTDTVLGTLDYIAPEQIEGGAVDRRADVYSLTVVLFEALTARLPYPAEHQLAKMYAHLSAEPPALAEVAPHLPEALDGVIQRGMAKKPDERYRTAGELAQAALAAIADMPAAPDAEDQPTAAVPRLPPQVPPARHRARRAVEPASIISTIAGTGERGSAGDGGPATQAQLNWPGGVAAIADGVVIADLNNDRLRRVALDGIIMTIVGTGERGFAGDGGPATQAQLSSPGGVAVAPDGGVIIADADNARVRRAAPDGTITTIAGTGQRGFAGDGGPATQAQLNWPVDVAIAPDGGLLIADLMNNRVRGVAPDGTITTVTGTGPTIEVLWLPLEDAFGGDGGPATDAKLYYPNGVAATADGGLLIADSYNNRVRYVAPDGTITTVAGTGQAGFGGDGGPAPYAKLNRPRGLAATPDGGIVIADTDNNRVRRVAPDGTITTVAGTGQAGLGGDGGPAAAASLDGPWSIAVTPEGDLLIADAGNRRIRRVSGAESGVSADHGAADAAPPAVCARCGDDAEPVSIAGERYCGTCGSPWSAPERAATPASGAKVAGGRPAASDADGAPCPHCGSSEPPAFVAGVPYCSQCGRELLGSRR